MAILFGLIVVLLLATFNAAPLAFFTMLFLGNLDINLGFVDLLPGAMAVHCIKNNLITYNNTKEIK